MTTSRSLLFGVLGLLVGSLIAIYANASLLDPLNIQDEQELAKKLTGMYVSDVSDKNFQIHTYETLVKGYYTVEDTGDSLRYTGYGLLADQYTYTTYYTPADKSDAPTTTPKEEIQKQLPIEEITPVYEEILTPISTTTP